MKVFIADDEVTILEGLKYIVDWEGLGCYICGEAKNGEEALNKILTLKPDLVLLDIRMPKLLGIDVVKFAYEHGFKGKFIILSGYSDFKYAQDAMRYGVKFYLTKPIEEDVLENAIKSIQATLQKEQLNTSTLSHYRQKAKDAILSDILLGKCDFTYLNVHDLHLSSLVYQVIIYENYNQDIFYNLYNFADLLRVVNEDNNSFDNIRFQDKEVVILKGQFALDRFAAFLEHYEPRPQDGSPLDSLFITYGSPVYRLEDIHLSYEQATLLLNRRFFCEQGQHILGVDSLFTPSDLTNNLSTESSNAYAELLSNMIQTYNRNKIVQTLSELEKMLYQSTADITSIKYFLADIYLQIKQTISHICHGTPIPFPTNASIINLIESKYYLYEIILFLSEQFEMIMNAIGSPSSEHVLDDILYYIEHNFRDNIKLETIAPLFGYNSSYLGKIFSKKVGKAFNTYLDEVRINHSKDLLLSDKLKVYQIAEYVGYKNVDYFHKKFKKYVGESPAEYRKKKASS